MTINYADFKRREGAGEFDHIDDDDLEHDWAYERSHRYSEEAFADFLEWRTLDLSEDQIEERMDQLRAEFMRT